MAWIKPRAGAEVDADQVREHCTGKLAHFKIPEHVHVLGADEEFPMTVTGKVKKNVLKNALQELCRPTKPAAFETAAPNGHHS